MDGVLEKTSQHYRLCTGLPLQTKGTTKVAIYCYESSDYI